MCVKDGSCAFQNTRVHGLATNRMNRGVPCATMAGCGFEMLYEMRCPSGIEPGAQRTMNNWSDIMHFQVREQQNSLKP